MNSQVIHMGIRYSLVFQSTGIIYPHTLSPAGNNGELRNKTEENPLPCIFSSLFLPPVVFRPLESHYRPHVANGGGQRMPRH